MWRTWKDPYRLLVTEVLLKQTRADTVAAMIESFFAQFPDPRKLADADSALESLVRPLGFVTQRAHQLRLLARDLVDSKLSIPSMDWSDLPGIGPYSSGMVAAALGTRGAVAVDTNIARLIGRLFGVTPSHAEARKSTNIWSLTESLTKGSTSPIRVLWGLLDLAAANCKARKPDCDSCPLAAECWYAGRR